jgi:hypothetical protein
MIKISGEHCPLTRHFPHFPIFHEQTKIQTKPSLIARLLFFVYSQTKQIHKASCKQAAFSVPNKQFKIRFTVESPSRRPPQLGLSRHRH